MSVPALINMHACMHVTRSYTPCTSLAASQQASSAQRRCCRHQGALTGVVQSASRIAAAATVERQAFSSPFVREHAYALRDPVDDSY